MSKFKMGDKVKVRDKEDEPWRHNCTFLCELESNCLTDECFIVMEQSPCGWRLCELDEKITLTRAEIANKLGIPLENLSIEG